MRFSPSVLSLACSLTGLQQYKHGLFCNEWDIGLKGFSPILSHHSPQSINELNHNVNFPFSVFNEV